MKTGESLSFRDFYSRLLTNFLRRLTKDKRPIIHTFGDWVNRLPKSILYTH